MMRRVIEIVADLETSNRSIRAHLSQAVNHLPPATEIPPEAPGKLRDVIAVLVIASSAVLIGLQLGCIPGG